MGQTAKERARLAAQRAKETQKAADRAPKATAGIASLENAKQPECWNIISGGPSRHQLTQADLFPDAPTIAVNNALDVSERLHVDVWAFWDHPEKLNGVGFQQYVKPPLTVWLGPQRFYELYLDGCGRTKRVEWEDYFDYRIGFRHMDKGLLPDPIKGNHRAAFSLIYVLEKCLRLGAKKIRILSCDMEGPWMPGTTTEAASQAVNRWNRWQYERTQVRTMCMLAKEKRGCEVEIYGLDMDAFMKGGAWKKLEE